MRNYWSLVYLVFIFTFGCASNLGSKVSIDQNQFVQSVESIDTEKVSQNVKCDIKKQEEKELTWKDFVSIANICVIEKKWSTVEEIGKLISELDFNNPWGSYYLSLAAESKNDYRRALWMVDQSLKKNSRFGLFHYQKGRVLWSLGEVDLALESINQSLNFDKNLLDAQLLKGKILVRDLEYSKAIPYFETVLTKRSKDFDSLDLLSYCAFKTKDPVKALKSVEKAIDIDPQQIHLRYRHAMIYETLMGSNSDALDVYKKIQSMTKKGRVKGELSVNITEKIKDLEAKIEKEKLEAKNKKSDENRNPSSEVVK